MWEYRVATMHYDAGITQSAEEIAEGVQRHLCALGAEGWEVITITSLSDMHSMPTVALCKRPLNADRTRTPSGRTESDVSSDRSAELPDRRG